MSTNDEIKKLEKQLEALKTQAEHEAEENEIQVEEVHEDIHRMAQSAAQTNWMLPLAIVFAALIIGSAVLYKEKIAGTEAQKVAAVAITTNPLAAAPSQVPQALAPQAPSAPVSVSADDDPFLGKKDAPVTLVVFSEFQCPFSKRFATETLPELKKQYIDTGKLKFVFRDYPLPFHPNAEPAAQAAECADEQGKFWDAHDKFFANQQALDSVSLKKYAQELSLNQAKFDQCFDSGKYKDEVKKDYDEGTKYGVSGTPTIYINGRQIVGAQPLTSFTSIIDEELKKLGK